MKNQNEYEKRCKAIQLYDEGVSFNKILQLVQRGKFWLSRGKLNPVCDVMIAIR